VGGVVVETIWWLSTKKMPEPMLATVAKWLLVWIGTGAVMGWDEWGKNESAYKQERGI
jgi:hypothetical protein